MFSRIKEAAAIVYLVKCLSSKEEKSVQFRLAARRSVLKYAIIQFIRTVNTQQLDIFNIRSNNEVIELEVSLTKRDADTQLKSFAR